MSLVSFVPVNTVFFARHEPRSLDGLLTSEAGGVKVLQLVCKVFTLSLRALAQINHASIFILHKQSSRIHLRSVFYHLCKLFSVPGCHRLRKRKLGGKANREPDFIGTNVGVRGDHRASGVVHALPHHILTEETLFLFKTLANTRVWQLACLCLYLGGIKESVHCILQLDPDIEGLCEFGASHLLLGSCNIEAVLAFFDIVSIV
mmetsp:Transcript_2722/g.4555  ORF Transcript_2722/g.4555 Transcript_2722/m.4555 type:complete len:204 (-) Transcript_2722:895-1506(-)